MSEEPEVAEIKSPIRSHALSIINTVSIVLGIILGVMHLKEISRHAEDISKFLKISSIGHLDEFVEQFEATQKNRTRFLSEVKEKTEEVRRRIGAGETGQTIYFSDSMEDYHALSGFWERSAAFVELGYFDFETVYALKAFPRNFWNDTAEVRRLLRENWYGKDQPLPDFLIGMEQLEKMYREEEEKN